MHEVYPISLLDRARQGQSITIEACIQVAAASVEEIVEVVVVEVVDE